MERSQLSYGRWNGSSSMMRAALLPMMVRVKLPSLSGFTSWSCLRAFMLFLSANLPLSPSTKDEMTGANFLRHERALNMASWPCSSSMGTNSTSFCFLRRILYTSSCSDSGMSAS